MLVWPSSPACPIRSPLKAGRLLGIRCLSGTPSRFSTPLTEHFQVPCASAGSIMVSLHNVMKHPVSTPLIINLPPRPVHDIDHVESYLPSFLHRFPSATIHYRWATSLETHPPQTKDEESATESATEADPAELLSRPTPLHWPTPIHDTLFAYNFLIRHLSPPPNQSTGIVLQRRPVYVYGSHLGASLAASLALTESHTHQPVAIRGLLAFNGIFNWTTLLPGHPNNKRMLDETPDTDTAGDNEQDFRFAKQLMPSHFDQPANLFDPFASPVLFFHSPGMLVPTSFTDRSSTLGMSEGFFDPYDQAYEYSDPEDLPTPEAYEDTDEMDTGPEDTSTDTSASADTLSQALLKPPRRGYMTFPPRASSLKIPETLLMHTTPPPGPAAPAAWKRPGAAENSFGTQALRLARLMRRSVNLFELSERAKWDFEFTAWETEALRRVQVQDVGPAGQGGPHASALGQQGEEVAARWLASRLG